MKRSRLLLLELGSTMRIAVSRVSESRTYCGQPAIVCFVSYVLSK